MAILKTAASTFSFKASRTGFLPKMKSDADLFSLLLNALDSLIQTMLKQRNDARASKNFEVADSVRDALNSAGILIEDTPQGSRWSINKEMK